MSSKIFDNLEKINVGDRYKNFKDFCLKIGINPPKCTDSKKALEKELQSYFKIKYLDSREFIIKEKYETKKKSKKEKEDEKYNGKGVYYILDEFDNLYIGSTTTSFKKRYCGHKSKTNVCESKEIMHNKHVFDILYDMSNIDDEYLIRACEYELIIWFKYNTKYKVINFKSDKSKQKKNKKKYRNIKISEDCYEKAIEMLNKYDIDYKDN